MSVHIPRPIKIFIDKTSVFISAEVGKKESNTYAFWNMDTMVFPKFAGSVIVISSPKALKRPFHREKKIKKGSSVITTKIPVSIIFQNVYEFLVLE